MCPGMTMGECSFGGTNVVTGRDLLLILPFKLLAGVPAPPIRRYDMSSKTWIPT